MPIDPQARALGEALGAGLDLSRLDLAVARAAADTGSGLAAGPSVARREVLTLAAPGGSLRRAFRASRAHRS